MKSPSNNTFELNRFEMQRAAVSSIATKNAADRLEKFRGKSIRCTNKIRPELLFSGRGRSLDPCPNSTAVSSRHKTRELETLRLQARKRDNAGRGAALAPLGLLGRDAWRSDDVLERSGMWRRNGESVNASYLHGLRR